jgi:hypothetical protein
MAKKTVFKKGPLALLREALGILLFTLAVIAIILTGLAQTAESSRAEGLRLLEESIRRAVAECYALEGRYPDSTEYIEKHYGVIIDKSRYIVHYELFASNIMPDIAVFGRRGQT